MNHVKELRRARGMLQKELAIALKVAQPSVSDWENQKSDPSDDNLDKLSILFGVEPSQIVVNEKLPIFPISVDRGSEWANVEYPPGVALRTSRPQPRQASALTEEDLEKIATIVNSGSAPRTPEARIVSFGMDNLPKETRERILNMIRAMFFRMPEEKYFEDKESNANDT